MKVKAKVEAIGNSEVGNRQRMANSEKGVGKRVTIPYALFPNPHWLLAIGYSPFPTQTLNRKLYIPPFLLEKT